MFAASCLEADKRETSRRSGFQNTLLSRSHIKKKKRAYKENAVIFSIQGVHGQSCKTAALKHDVESFTSSASPRQKKFLVHSSSPLLAPQKTERNRSWLRSSTSESGSYFTHKAMVLPAEELLHCSLEAKTVVGQVCTTRCRGVFSQEYNGPGQRCTYFLRMSANRCDDELPERKPPPWSSTPGLHAGP